MCGVQMRLSFADNGSTPVAQPDGRLRQREPEAGYHWYGTKVPKRVVSAFAHHHHPSSSPQRAPWQPLYGLGTLLLVTGMLNEGGELSLVMGFRVYRVGRVWAGLRSWCGQRQPQTKSQNPHPPQVPAPMSRTPAHAFCHLPRSQLDSLLLY